MTRTRQAARRYARANNLSGKGRRQDARGCQCGADIGRRHKADRVLGAAHRPHYLRPNNRRIRATPGEGALPPSLIDINASVQPHVIQIRCRATTIQKGQSAQISGSATHLSERNALCLPHRWTC